MLNFSQIGQKITEAGILTRNDTENCLMKSYLPHSDGVIKIIIDFERFCSRVSSCQVWCNWTTNKGKTEGGTMVPAYKVPKDPSLNRVNHFYLESQTYIWHSYKWNFAALKIYLQPVKIKSQYFGVSLKWPYICFRTESLRMKAENF